MDLKVKDCKTLFDTYGLPDHKLKEINKKFSLIEYADFLLNSCGNSPVIISRDSNGQPLILSEGIGCQLVSALEFDYED